MARRDPSNERAFYHLARRTELAGQTRLAMDSYWKALQRDEDDDRAWSGWARTTERVLGPEKAKQVIDLWLKRAPNSDTAWMQLAHLHQRVGEHQEAYDAASHAASSAPSDADAWQAMGMEASALARTTDAEAAFRRAIACAPGDWRNHAGLGEALSSQHRSAEAIASLREAIRLAPEAISPHLELGAELLKTAATDADVNGARAELKRALGLAGRNHGPLEFQAHFLMGEASSKQRRWQDALAWYRTAEALGPYDATLQYSLVRVCRALGDVVNARKAEARHLELDAYDRRVAVLLDRIHVSPDDADARIKVARLYAAHNEIGPALANYRAALATAPQMAVARREMDALILRAAASAH